MWREITQTLFCTINLINRDMGKYSVVVPISFSWIWDKSFSENYIDLIRRYYMYHCVSSKRFIAFYQILRLLIRWIASQNFENVKLLKKLSMHFGWFKYNASTKFLSQLDVIHEELVIWILQYMWILIITLIK